MGYQPFLVAPISSGISTYLKPFMQPEDAFTDMQDCFCYRGSVRQRDGYDLFDNFPSIAGLDQAAWTDGTTTTYSGTLPFIGGGTDVGKKSLAISHVNSGTIVTNGTDDGAGNITGTNIAAGSTINYTTGAWTINFTAAPTKNFGLKIVFGIKLGVGNGTTGPYALSLPSTSPFSLPINPRSLVVGASTAPVQLSNTPFEIEADDGLTGDLTNTTPGNVTAGTITYATGAITNLTFTNVVAAGNDIWARWEYLPATTEPIKGIKFVWTTTGNQNTIVFTNTQAALVDAQNFKLTNISGPNFFTLTAADKQFYSVANYLNKAFILNNKDPLTVWDGTFLYQPTVSLTGGGATLTTGLLVTLFKNRLIIFRPTWSTLGIRPQQALFSALNNPFDFITDALAHGGFVDAATNEWFITYEFLRDEIEAGFQESTWKFRYTGIDTDPYRWQKINDSRRVDAPYATVSFQNFITELGSNGFLRCDGVNTERYDDKIIDLAATSINQDNIDICNAIRYDLLNQQFICYPRKDLNVADFCENWLVWNFLENSFAIYNIAATCFGFYVNFKDLAWEDFTAANKLDYAWEDFKDQNWLSYFAQGNAKIGLFGTKDGKVMKLISDFATDNGTNFGFDFTSVQFNPFLKQGQQARFGFIDLYFDRPLDFPAVDPNYLISIDFFLDEQEAPYQTIIFNPSEDDFIKKRIYSGAIGNFHSFRIYLSDDQIANSTAATKGFTLNGFILWMQPGGRIIQ